MLERALVQVVTSPEVLQPTVETPAPAPPAAPGPKPPAPAKVAAKPAAAGPTLQDRFTKIRTVVSTIFPPNSDNFAWLLLTTKQGSIRAMGMTNPIVDTSVPENAAVMAPGSFAAVLSIDDGTWLVSSAKISAVEKGTVTAVGTLTLGIPLLNDAQALDAVAKEYGVAALGVISEGTVLASSGPQKQLVATALKALKPGAAAAIEARPPRAAFQPKLPLFPPQPQARLGLRQQLLGGALEVIAVSNNTETEAPQLIPFQKTVLIAAGGLLLLGLIMLIFTKETPRGVPMVVGSMPRPSTPPRESLHISESLPPTPPEPKVSPEDFEMPDLSTPDLSRRSLANATEPPRPAIPSAPPSVPPLMPPHESKNKDSNAAGFPEVSSRLMPPAPPPPPLNMAPSQKFPTTSAVAPLPGSEPKKVPAFRASSVQSSPSRSSLIREADPERALVATFEEFIATKSRCGESVEGVTLEKFRAKLQKSKETLIAKHNCRSVRFEVYVKDGRAAIRALPVM